MLLYDSESVGGLGVHLLQKHLLLTVLTNSA